MPHGFRGVSGGPATARPGPLRLRRLLALLAFPLCLLACGDEDEGFVASSGGGVIEGRVLSPAFRERPVLQAFSGDDPHTLRAMTTTDSTGAWSLALPFGRYQLLCQAGGAITWYAASGPTTLMNADTLVLAPDRPQLRCDFAFGGLHLRVDAPGLVSDEPFLCRLVNAVSGREEMSVPAQPHEDRLVWELPFVPPGRHRIGLETPQGQEFTVPLGGEPPEEPTLVTAGVMTDVVLSLPAPTYITGSVHGSWQRLRGFLPDFDRPQVLLRLRESPSSGDRFSVARGQTDEEGNFAFLAYGFEALPWVNIGGVQRGLDDFSYPGSAIRIESGRETRLPDYVESGLFLTLELPDGTYAVSATIEVTDESGVVRARARLGNGNCAAVCNLLPGSYRVRVTPGDYTCGLSWLATWYDGADSLSEATPVVIATAGSVVAVNARLLPSGLITGAFVAAGPDSAPRRSLAAVPADGDTNLVVCSVSDLDPDAPSFRIRGLADGAYRLLAVVETGGRVRRWWYPGSASADRAEPVTIRRHAAVEGLTWMLP